MAAAAGAAGLGAAGAGWAAWKLVAAFGGAGPANAGIMPTAGLAGAAAWGAGRRGSSGVSAPDRAPLRSARTAQNDSAPAVRRASLQQTKKIAGEGGYEGVGARRESHRSSCPSRRGLPVGGRQLAVAVEGALVLVADPAVQRPKMKSQRRNQKAQIEEAHSHVPMSDSWDGCPNSLRTSCRPPSGGRRSGGRSSPCATEAGVQSSSCELFLLD